MKIHEKLQRGIERVLFKGKSTKSSAYLTYAVGNVVLMLLLFYALLNNIAYNWTGQLYPVGSGYGLNFLFGGLDSAIPFVPEMVIFYVYLFYPMVILTMIYFAFIEFKKGYALGWSLVFTNAIAILFYVVFPVSTFWWRQDFLANPITGNFWASQVYSIWANDTSFNCFPSLHAAVSTICFFTWFQYSRARPSSTTRLVAIAVLAIAGGVISSTLFIKQHYIADQIAGILLAGAVCRLTFSHLWKRQSYHNEPTTNSHENSQETHQKQLPCRTTKQKKRRFAGDISTRDGGSNPAATTNKASQISPKKGLESI